MKVKGAYGSAHSFAYIHLLEQEIEVNVHGDRQI